MITGKINLRQLRHELMTTPKGTKCIVIPIAEASLFEGEKGIYLDIVAFDIKNKKDDQKDTHLVKQSFSKEIMEKMTDEQKKAIPILGNLRVLGDGSYSEPEPNSSGSVASGVDDLPF